jgi:anti-sigma factor RsiW
MSLKDELLSAYIDGEVESPHREHIERQIASNADVRARYHRLRAVSERLRSEPMPDFSEARRRVWKNLENLPTPHPSFWRQRWQLPAPAVAAAALVFAFLLGFSVWQIVTPPAEHHGLSEVVQAGAPVDLTINLADSDVERLLQWLSSREMLGEIKVELPEAHQFEIMGDAELLRAADFGRSRQ